MHPDNPLRLYREHGIRIAESQIVLGGKRQPRYIVNSLYFTRIETDIGKLPGIIWGLYRLCDAATKRAVLEIAQLRPLHPLKSRSDSLF